MNFTREHKIILVLGFIILGLLFYDDEDIITHKNTYINASSINGTGFSASSGNNTSLITQMNFGYWHGDEDNGIPWSLIIEFHNVTHFDSIETYHKYNSSGTASTHIVSRYIWCETHNEWVELEEFTTENNWYYKSVYFSESDHFIMANGTVQIKYVHPANGITSHDIYIDVCRLAARENEIIG